jgi:hypothetical protein
MVGFACACCEIYICLQVCAVAMTRPKRHLCVIGDSETIGKYGVPPLA